MRPLFICLGFTLGVLTAQTVSTGAQAQDTGGGNVNSITTGSFNCPAGSAIVAYGRWNSTSGGAVVTTSAGDTLTAGASSLWDSSKETQQFFYILSTVGGSSITATLAFGASSYPYPGLNVACASKGSIKIDVNGSSNVATSGTNMTSGSFATATAPEIIFTGCTAGGDGAPMSAAGSSTLVNQQNAASGLEYWFTTSNQNTNTAMTLGGASTVWGCLVLSIAYPTPAGSKRKQIFERQLGAVIVDKETAAVHWWLDPDSNEEIDMLKPLADEAVITIPRDIAHRANLHEIEAIAMNAF